MADLRIISVDDHVVEAPDAWTSRLPAKYKDVCLRYVIEDGEPTWQFEDVRIVPFRGNYNGAVWPVTERRPVWEPPRYEDLLPAAKDPVARLAAMDRDGIEAAVLFPNLVRFCGQLFSEAANKKLGWLSIQAYNDWIFEEWAAIAPERLIPAVMIPLWDPKLAAAELERMAARGGKCFTFSEGPHQLGLPSIHDPGRFWDPVLSTANDAGMVVCTHLGSSSSTPISAPDAPQGVGIALFQLAGQETCLDWLHSGHFDRFPNLQLCLSECGVGWVPAVLGLAEWSRNMAVERSPQPGQQHNEPALDDEQGQVFAAMTEAASEQARAGRPPREVFHDHIYVCLIEEVHGVQFFEEIGLDNILIETDYPHMATRWPNSIDYARRATPGMSDTNRARIFNGNARRLFGIGPDGEAQKKQWIASRPAPAPDTPTPSPLAAAAAAVGLSEEELMERMSKFGAGMKQRKRVEASVASD